MKTSVTTFTVVRRDTVASTSVSVPEPDRAGSMRSPAGNGGLLCGPTAGCGRQRAVNPRAASGGTFSMYHSSSRSEPGRWRKP